MEENQIDWDENLKVINFAISTMKNQTTGFSPLELVFEREPNIPSTIANSSTLTYQDLIRKWKKKYENYIKKVRERILLESEKTKKRLDEGIIRKLSQDLK